MVGNRTADVGSAVPLREVARRVPAIVRLNGEIVIVVDVALRAGSRCMSPGQREARDCMVEGTDIGPGNCVVARGAIGHCEGRTRGWMCRIVGLLPGGEVATGVTTVV